MEILLMQSKLVTDFNSNPKEFLKTILFLNQGISAIF